MSKLQYPTVSVITAVFNGESHIEETILSVINQTYNNIEYIIIDGGSTDGTVEIIKKYEKKIKYWISEKDKGISDAFNKGILQSTGDYINFQGDGDGFCSNSSVAEVMDGVDCQKDMLVSARIKRIDERGCTIYLSQRMSKFKKTSLLFRMSMPHQGLFTHRSLFEKYGLFDVENTFCMDYEHLLRAYKSFPRVIQKDVVVAKWRSDGIGNNRELEVLKEYNKIKIKNKIANPLVLQIINNWILLKYGIKKALGFLYAK